ncbi:MAG: hypothetical protein C0501_20280 [Isosphaera sp.]|nr:hypothetical protein [Isosphaera sp.]
MRLVRREPELRHQLGVFCLVAGFAAVLAAVWLGVESLTTDPTDFGHVFAVIVITTAGSVGVPRVVVGFVLRRRRAR